MPKLPVALRLPPETVERIEQIAERDHRTVANVVSLLVDRALPGLECEVMGVEQGAETKSQEVDA